VCVCAFVSVYVCVQGYVPSCVNEDQIKPPSPLPPSPHPPPVPVRGQKGDVENAPTLAGDGLRTGREAVTRGVCVCVCLYMSVYVPSCVRLLCGVSVCECVHLCPCLHKWALASSFPSSTPGRQSEEVGSQEDPATSLTQTRDGRAGRVARGVCV